MAQVSRTSQPRTARGGVEAAFRDALQASIDGLELSDRTLVRFHYFHGLGTGQLAAMLGDQRAAIVRRLARIRERLLRETLRSLAIRLGIERSETGGGDPDGSAGGAGGSAPRGIERSETGGGDPDGSAGGAGGSAPRGINRGALDQLIERARDRFDLAIARVLRG